MNTFTKEVFESAISGDNSHLISIPRTDLHAHGLLSASFERVKKILPSIPPPPEQFNNFKEFIDYININYFSVNDISAYEFKLYEAAILTMIDDGVVYTEMSFDLFSPFSAGISWEKFAGQIKELKDKYADKIFLNPELGVHRATPKDFLESQLPQALATGIFGSTDLYGDYNAGQVKDFIFLFSMAKDAGLKIKYHSGELIEADNMYEDLKAFEPDSIQHGITSIRNPYVLNRLAEKDIMCNVCLTSNLKLAGIDRIEDHPVRKMFDAGIKISLGTDDLAIFGTSVSEDYIKLYKNGIFTVEELEHIRQNGMEEAIKVIGKT